MNEKKIEPTDAMVDAVEFAREFVALDARTIMRAALNHPDAPGLFECDYTDYVHVDEDDLRAAREQGWDQATRWIDSYQGGPNGRTTSARSANPHRPVQELPTEPGAVIVPADGHEYIETRAGKKSRRLTWDAECYVWYDARGTHLAADIIPDTWKVDGQ